MSTGLQANKRPDKVNILLVDDQPARLLSYETILGELGQNLVTARSGVDALARLMKEDFAVVLLDVSMPGMDGFETAAMIHEHPRFERTPIIFVTGVHDTELDRLKGYKLGAVDYVSIPVVPEILRSKVSVLVELYCQRLELEQLNRSLAEANKQLEQANTTLQAEKTRELEALNRDLKHANLELEDSNRALQAEIVERSRAQAALIEADKHKDEFLAILAHELRNPLAPIRNAIEIMSRIPIENAKLKWSRDVIDRQVLHLTRLVDDLLDISRITRGTIRLAQEPVSAETLLARAIEALQPLISEHKHELSIECPDGSLTVRGDPTRLVQVLGNLLNNAAKYTHDGGRIVLSAKREGRWLVFRVKDTGIGIPLEYQAKLFTLFSRLHGSDDRTPGGLGIGLALVRKLVEMHSGEVSMYSAGAGKGAEFTVRLPLIESTPGTDEASSSDADVERRLAPRRILVADDNPDALESLAMLLECDGHHVWKAADGAQAIELAAKWRPDLALLDLGMPVMDGYEAARRMRAQSWGKDMMIVALSGWGQNSDVLRSRECGFDTHLVKPASSEALAQLLARVPGREVGGV
ncbi:MAG TPA: response regulator [Steroidobacteraceae bacterium]